MCLHNHDNQGQCLKVLLVKHQINCTTFDKTIHNFNQADVCTYAAISQSRHHYVDAVTWTMMYRDDFPRQSHLSPKHCRFIHFKSQCYLAVKIRSRSIFYGACALDQGVVVYFKELGSPQPPFLIIFSTITIGINHNTRKVCCIPSLSRK